MEQLIVRLISVFCTSFVQNRNVQTKHTGHTEIKWIISHCTFGIFAACSFKIICRNFKQKNSREKTKKHW